MVQSFPTYLELPRNAGGSAHGLPQNAASWVHFIFYISGTGGENSGGTAILGDNEFKHVIFEPTKMTNTCMIFDPVAPFFHGVRPLALGKYRWMASAEYVSSESAG